jgi:MazG family protein
VDERPLYRLVEIVNRLLGPGGCPWDRAQTHESLKKYLLEETYEVFDAIDRGDRDDLCEELGDLLLQPVLHAQMEAAAGSFDIDAVATAICDKLIRRHPHVFGDATADDAETVLKNWDAIKRTEKPAAKQGILSGVPKSMPSLLRAHEISKRAARCGFEWENIEDVFEKLHEEERELREAIEVGDSAQIEAELGDLLFTAVNLGRWSNAEPEEALRKMLDRFTERFSKMELLAEQPLGELSPEAWNNLWEHAKSTEKSNGTLAR